MGFQCGVEEGEDPSVFIRISFVLSTRGHRLMGASLELLPLCAFPSLTVLADSDPWVITISMRRFLLRPLSVSFVAIGLPSAYPADLTRSASSPPLMRT
jgi:hypothetical protein